MTQHEMDQLFASARTAPAQTSIEEVTAWVGAAAIASTGVLGIAAKLKLFIAKKSLLMLGSVLGTVGIVAVTAFMIGSSSNPESEKTTRTETYIQESSTENEEIQLISSTEDTLEMPDVIAPLPPISPKMTPPVNGLAPRMLESMYVLIEMPTLATYPEPIPFMEARTPAGATPPANANCCDKGKKIEGNGNVTKKEYAVGSFKMIEVNGVFDVFIRQGESESVTVEIDENLQDAIVVKNNQETLVLDNNEDINIKKSTKSNIYVTVKDLSKISVNGVGDVKTEAQISGKKLTVIISGVSDVELDIAYELLTVNYHGVGDAKLKGKVDKAELKSSGVGDLLAYELNAKQVDLDQSGVGDAEVYASEVLDINFSGVGNVYYKGEPASKNIDKSGIGSVKHR